MKTFIDRIASSAGTRFNTIGDGHASVAYSELPHLLDKVDRFLCQFGSESSSVAVECTNSVSGALLLLALLRSGRSFALAPPDVSGATIGAALKPVPNFCSHRISVPASDDSADTGFPDRLFRVEPNPVFNKHPPPPGRLFLRTSGSMGASKIVVHSHERLLGNAENCILKYDFSPASRAVIPVPIAHMYGFGAEFLPAVLSGAAIDLQEKTNIITYLDRERRFNPTIAFVTPAICAMLLKGYRKPRTGYRVMVTSGQRIGEDDFRALDPLVGGRLVNQYGSSELGATAACDPGDTLDRRATAIGEPMSGVQLRIDPVTRELFCLHPCGFEGYVDEDGAWLRKLEPGEWFGTGDLAAVQPDGSTTVLGRADASVNRSGYLVLLSDIERIMEKLDAVGEIAVVAAGPDGKHGVRIAAFCVPRSPLEGGQLRRNCFAVLPHHAIPDEVRIIEKMPVLPSGKIDRKALERILASN